MVRRGYDRAQVEGYLDDVASQLEDLRSLAVEAKASALAIGIDDAEALANELANIGGEVGAVLEAARAAAEGLRTRAAKDAGTWRSDAERVSTAVVADATEQSQSMRAAAWNEGTSMLTSAQAEAHTLLETAQEDSLFMRAEAERDALRLTSDSRRDKDELLRAARLEADSIIEEARTESDAVLAAADQQAEAAQERARALEDRRSELLSELEATRASISQLEEEIDSRRQALDEPEPASEPEPEIRAPYSVDSGSVRIVAPSKVVALRPVDPDELVADVEAIRSASRAKAEPSARAEEPTTVAVIAPPPLREVVAAEVVDAPEAPSVTSREGEDEPVAATEASSDEISSLFAKLRDDTAQQPAVDAATPPKATEEPEMAAAPEPVAKEPAPEPSAKTETKPKVSQRAKPAEAPEVETTETDGPSGALAAQNAALRVIKRTLVDLQNETLEALRGDESWLPAEDLMNRFSKPFAAFGKSVGTGSTTDTSTAFTSDLHDAVTSAIEDERGRGSGSRAVASAASKVFRTWRSDEAERRLLALTP